MSSHNFSASATQTILDTPSITISKNTYNKNILNLGSTTITATELNLLGTTICANLKFLNATGTNLVT